MNRAMWKKLNKMTDKCYSNMIGADKDNSCWQKTFDYLIECVREERTADPNFATELNLVDDESDYEYGVSDWIEDCLDEIDMREQYDVLLSMCDTLLSMFSWPEYSGSDLKFRKSVVLGQLGREQERVRFCEAWLKKEPENVMAATASVYAWIAVKAYDEAKTWIRRFIPNDSDCCEENEIMFRAAVRYYEAIGDRKKQKQLKQALKDYEEYVDQCLEAWCTDDGDDAWEDFDLPFN